MPLKVAAQLGQQFPRGGFLSLGNGISCPLALLGASQGNPQIGHLGFQLGHPVTQVVGFLSSLGQSLRWSRVSLRAGHGHGQ